MISPIVLFVYNRPWHTQQTIEALKANTLACESVLYVYSDAQKNEDAADGVAQVRKIINQIEGFKKVIVIEQVHNLGLANSVISGVSNVLKTHERVVVLEDDLITSPYFLEFMNKGLELYENDENILSITGFSFSSEFMNFPSDFHSDIYLNIRPMSWGWATWRHQWEGVDWDVKDFNNFMSTSKKRKQFNAGGTDLTNMLIAQMNGEIDSWYIRWCYHAFIKNKYTIYPRVSFVNNIGHDRSGVHCAVDSESILSHTEINLSNNFKFEKSPVLDDRVISAFNKAFNLKLIVKLKRLIKKLLRNVKNY